MVLLEAQALLEPKVLKALPVPAVLKAMLALLDLPVPEAPMELLAPLALLELQVPPAPRARKE
jgi:hypothetical protein